MKLRRLYQFLLLAAAGGMVFQTTASCQQQFIETFATTMVETLVSVIVSSLASGLSTGTT